MKTLYLHVGPHKTGSTYIQACLAKNAEALLGRGIVYPATGISPTIPHLCGHHELILWLAGKENKRNAFGPNQLLDDLGEADVAILSSENTCGLSREELTRIRAHFVGWSIRPLMFLRRRSAILRSQWQENIKWGEYYDLTEFVLSKFIHPHRSNLINQKLLLDKMADVFGKDALIVMNYDLSIEQGNDIADELMIRLFGDSVISIGSGETLNASMPSSIIDLIRVFNAAYRSIGGVPGDVVRGMVIKLFQDTERNPVHTAHELIQEVAASRTMFVDIGHMDRLFPGIEQSILREFRNQLPADQPPSLFPEQGHAQTAVPTVRIADLLLRISDTLALKEVARKYFPRV